MPGPTGTPTPPPDSPAPRQGLAEKPRLVGRPEWAGCGAALLQDWAATAGTPGGMQTRSPQMGLRPRWGSSPSSMLSPPSCWSRIQGSAFKMPRPLRLCSLSRSAAAAAPGPALTQRLRGHPHPGRVGTLPGPCPPSRCRKVSGSDPAPRVDPPNRPLGPGKNRTAGEASWAPLGQGLVPGQGWCRVRGARCWDQRLQPQAMRSLGSLAPSV